MRYLIGLLFVIPLLGQTNQNPPGEVCVKGDFQQNSFLPNSKQDKCCKNTMLTCADLRSNDVVKSCCNANPQCTWVTNKQGVPSNIQNTCQADTSIKCTAQTINNCTITTGTYNHNTIASSKVTPKKANCASGYSGECSYKCYGGVWHAYTSGVYTGNQCKRNCNAETKNNCSLTASNHGQKKTGTCTTDTGTCSRTCNDGQWVRKSDDTHTCRSWRRCESWTPNSLKCPKVPLNHNGQAVRNCIGNYTGTNGCSYRCNDSIPSGGDSGCKRKCITTWSPDTTKCDNLTLNLAHNQRHTGNCKSGYTGNCTYTCNNGIVGGSSAGCTQAGCQFQDDQHNIEGYASEGQSEMCTTIDNVPTWRFCPFSDNTLACVLSTCRNGKWVSKNPNVPHGSFCWHECFIADTLITMSDGTKKVIQDVKKGDKVKGAKGINTILEVKKLHARSYSGLVYSINGSRPFVTPGHPFMTTKGWRSFDDQLGKKLNPNLDITKLKVGDILIKEDGTKEVLKEFYSEYQDTKIYNFRVSGDRTYYADGYLVHNK